jgi:hypothetical protein
VHLHALGPTQVPEEDTDGNIQLVSDFDLRITNMILTFLTLLTHSLQTVRRVQRGNGERRVDAGDVSER